MLRVDLKEIYDWIPPRSRVLDLGCGKGELLQALTKHKSCIGYGVEIDTDRVLLSMQKGINVIQGNIDNDLSIFKDDNFDLIVLSQTIQAMRNTEAILREMMRIGKQAIVTFPNFGYWQNRIQIGFGGHMPVSKNMPYDWYDTPNIHWCTLNDFEKLCFKNNIKVEQRVVLSGNKEIKLLPNLFGSLAMYRIARKGL